MKHLKRRVLAILLAVSMLIPAALPEMVYAQETATEAVEENGNADESNPVETENDTIPESETGDVSQDAPEDSKKDEVSEETGNVDDEIEKTSADTSGEENPNPEEALPEETDAKDSFKVYLEDTENGSLIFPFDEEPVMADENDPMKAMEEAIAQMERQEEKREKSVKPGEEVSVRVASAYGYELADLFAIATETGEEIQKLETDENGELLFTMPDMDITISAEFKEIEIPEEEKDAIEDAKNNAAGAEKKSRIASRAAASKSIGLNVGPTVWYGAYLTNYFTTSEGFYAYCLEPRRATPYGGTYTATLVNNSYVRKAAFYSYGGPGYTTYKSRFGNIGDGSQQYEYCYSHVVISYIYAKYYVGSNSEANYAFLGLDEWTKQALINVANNMLSMPEPPATYSCYYMNTSSVNGNGWTQSMLCQTYNQGNLKLKKSSTNTSISANNKQYSLEGAVYGVYTDAGCSNQVATFTTDANGNSNTVNLDAGTYYVKEKTAPKGFELSKEVKKVTVVSSQTVTVNVSDKPIDDPAMIRIYKQDALTGDAIQGGASLAGAQFTIKYYDDFYTEKNLPNKATRTWVIETKEIINDKGETVYITGMEEQYKVSGDSFYKNNGIVTVPRGTLTIEESKAPEGYENDLKLTDSKGNGGDSLYLVQIKEPGDMAMITGGHTFKGSDTVVRGDFSFTKVNGKTNEVMANIPFRIYCRETGQEVIVRTDKNGYFSSQSSYANHSDGTNNGEAGSGIWFGDTDHVDDSVGALPYGTYYIEELECDENVGLKLFSGEFVISENETVFDFGKVVNNSITIDTKVYTNGYNSTGFTGVGLITDTVKISGMSEGYAELTLMDRETGETLKDENGEIIKGGAAVTKSSEAGFDGTASPSVTLSEKTLADLRGKSIVCCVKLYKRNSDGSPDYSRVYAVHNDMEDADETLPFAKVVTELTEKETGKHEVLLKNSDTVLADTVKFENLPKKGHRGSMTITGTLVNASGSPINGADGNPIQDVINVSETDDFSKTYTLEYTIPSSILRKYEGKTMHSFVEVKMGSTVWTYEKDTDNADQTITVPTIKETQTNKDILVSEDTGITDLVKLEGLMKGNTYTLVGKIVDKSNGKVITIDGKELSSSHTFQADGTASEQEVHFNFEPDDLRGKGYVVFEYLYLGDGSDSKMLDNNLDTDNLLMDGIHAFADSIKDAIGNVFGTDSDNTEKAVEEPADSEEPKKEPQTIEPEGSVSEEVEESDTKEHAETEESAETEQEGKADTGEDKEETAEEPKLEGEVQTGTTADPNDVSIVDSLPVQEEPGLLDKAKESIGDVIDTVKEKIQAFADEAAMMDESDVQDGLGRTVIMDFMDFEETGTVAYTERQIPEDQKETIQNSLPISLPILTKAGEENMAVTWECDDDVMHTEFDEYTFYPKWNDNYVLSEELQKKYDDFEIVLPYVTVRISEPEPKVNVNKENSDKILKTAASIEEKLLNDEFTYEGILNELKGSGFVNEVFSFIGMGMRDRFYKALTDEQLMELKQILIYEFASVIPQKNAKKEEVQHTALLSDFYYEIAQYQDKNPSTDFKKKALDFIGNYDTEEAYYKELSNKKQINVNAIIDQLQSSNMDEFKDSFCKLYGYNSPQVEGSPIASGDFQNRACVSAVYGNWTGPGPSSYRVVAEIWDNGNNGSSYNILCSRYLQVADGSAFWGTVVNTSWNGYVTIDGPGNYAVSNYNTTVGYGQYYSHSASASYNSYSSSATASWTAPNPIYNLTVNYYSNGATSVNGKPATSSNQYLGNYVFPANKTNNHYNFSTWGLQRTGYIGTRTWGTTTTGGYIQDEDTNMLGRDMAKGLGVDISKGHKTVNVYALWKPVNYFVQYDGNGATSGTTAKSSHTYDVDKALSKNGFSRPGHVFAGWAKTPDGEVVYTDEQITKNIGTENNSTVTLYAKWTPLCTLDVNLNVNDEVKNDAEGYLTFDVSINGKLVADDVTDYYNQSLPSGTTYQIRDIKTKPGIRYTKTISNVGYPITKSGTIDIYCITSYRINYDANGATSGNMYSQQMLYTDTRALLLNDFEKTGYIFDGWNTKADGSGTFYADRQIVKGLSKEPNGIVTLYAQWLDPNLSNTHNDLRDEKQSFYVPEIVKTVLTTADGEKYFSPSGTGTLVDTITYSGLSSHIEYTIKGQLVNKDTGAVVEEASMKFTPTVTDGSEGTVQFEYTIDKSKYAGVTLVSYQTLYADVMDYGKPTGKLTELTSEKDINNADQTVTCMQIDTLAKDKTSGTKIISPSSDTVVVDTVTYQGAVKGTMYCLEATLMDKYREEPAKDKTGKVIMTRDFFTADASSGSTDVEISFDSTKLHSGEYVVFERLYELKLPGAQQIFYTAHEDYNDADQTVYIAGLDTNIYNTDNMTNVAYPSESLTVRDIISYTGFLTGKTYTVEWSLYDTDTKAVYKDADGKAVTKTQTFTPTEMNGEFELEATFNASNLNGKALTAVTNIKLDGTTVLKHNTTLDNEYETLLVPKITTKAFDTRNKTQEATAIKNASITDTVSYTMLQAGMGHIIKTTLVDKATGDVLKDAAGKDLIFSEEFKPEASEGSYDVVLEFDATNLLGKTAVVYQEIYMGDNIVAQHKDINAESQTLHFTGIGETKASVIKRIKAEDFYDTHGDVSFIFKMEGEDLSGEPHTLHTAATFTEEYVKANTDEDGWVSIEAFFENVPCGVYTVTESDVSRYHLTDVQSDSKEVKAYDDHAVYTLETINDEEYPTSIFTNEKHEWQDYSDSTMVINNFKNKPELEGKVIITGEPVDGNQLTANVTDMQDDAELSYQWYRGEICIGKTKTYTVTSADVGVELICKVTDASGKYKGTLTSEPVGPIQEAPKAFAVYSADDQSLNFYKRSSIPAVGSQFEGKTVTNVYTGVEKTGFPNAPWHSIRGNVLSVKVVDEIIPKSCYQWFYGFENANMIDVTRLNTSNVTDMYCMFYECSALQTLNISNFDTSNVRDMSGMFGSCYELQTLDLKSFETSNVKNMSGMFNYCSALQTLDLSSFDTSNVLDMSNMFSSSGVQRLDLSNFDTLNVTEMGNIFNGCSELQSLDLSNFDTSNVTGLYGMFQNCSSLSALDMSSFDTSKVTNMNFMFSGCSELQSLDLSNFDTSNVTSMTYMFEDCFSLQTLNLSSFDTSKVTGMNYMFYNCSELQTLDLSNFDASNVTNMSRMFRFCSKLQTIKTPKNIKTPKMEYITSKKLYDASDDYKEYPAGKFPTNITESHTLVSEKPSLESFAIYSADDGSLNFYKRYGTPEQGSKFEGKTVTNVYADIESMNINRYSDVPWYDIRSKIRTVVIADNITPLFTAFWFYEFTNCSSIDLGKLDTSNVTDMESMFNGCSSLSSVDVTNFDTSNVTDMSYMFNKCSSLTSIDLSSFDASNVRYMQMIFTYCDSLKRIETPYNIKSLITGGAYLPKTFYDASNNYMECPIMRFPMNITESHTLVDKIPE